MTEKEFQMYRIISIRNLINDNLEIINILNNDNFSPENIFNLISDLLKLHNLQVIGEDHRVMILDSSVYPDKLIVVIGSNLDANNLPTKKQQYIITPEHYNNNILKQYTGGTLSDNIEKYSSIVDDDLDDYYSIAEDDLEDIGNEKNTFEFKICTRIFVMDNIVPSTLQLNIAGGNITFNSFNNSSLTKISIFVDYYDRLMFWRPIKFDSIEELLDAYTFYYILVKEIDNNV